MAAKPAPDLPSPQATQSPPVKYGWFVDPVWFETGMSHSVLPTDRGLLRNLLWEKLTQSQPFFQRLALCVQTLGSNSVFLLSLHSTGTWLALRRRTLNNHIAVTHASPKAAWLLAYKT